MSTNTSASAGKALHDADEEARREAARKMGSARTERKAAASRATAASRKGVTLTEEQRERQRQGQLARWERIRAERAAAGLTPVVVEKKRAGRPRKVQEGMRSE
jgi:hypothetical protein